MVFHDTRAFAAVEWAKKKLRRGSRFFAETHTAFPRAAYRRMIEQAGLVVDREEDWDPLSIPLVSVADGLGLGPKVDGRQWVEKLLAVDRWFNRHARRVPGLKRFGSINVIHARKPDSALNLC